MRYILKFSKLFEFLNTKSRKMMDLINYFNLSLVEKTALIPKWFERVYPDQSREILLEWIHGNLNLFADDLDGIDEDDYDSVLPNEVYFLTDKQEEKYTEYLYDFLMDKYRQTYSVKRGEYDVFPLFFTYDIISEIESEYLIHFTNSLVSLNAILSGGFIGVDSIDYLVNTQIGLKYSDEYSSGGFVFGYEIDNGVINMSNNYGLFFKASSILVHHNQDEEEQNIFIADEVDSKTMIGFEKRDDLYYTLDGKYSGDTVEMLAENMNLIK